MSNEIEAIGEPEVTRNYASHVGTGDLAGVFDVFRLITAIGVIPLYDRMTFSEWLLDLGVTPLRPQRRLHVIAEEVGDRLPRLGPEDFITYGHDLVVHPLC
jgi:hypothetical protein